MHAAPTIEFLSTKQKRNATGRSSDDMASITRPNPSVPPKSAALAPAAALRSSQFPTFAPLLEEIELAGWSSNRRRLSGNFHDWMLMTDGRTCAIVGQAATNADCDATAAALAAQSAWVTVRAHALHTRDAGELLSLAARSLWSMPAGNPLAHVAVALVDPLGGHTSLAVAGDCLVWRIRAASIERQIDRQPALGAAANFTYRAHEFSLSLRERLLLAAGASEGHASQCAAPVESAFSGLDAESHRRMTAGDAVTLARGQFEKAGKRDADLAVSIVTVRRR